MGMRHLFAFFVLVTLSLNAIAGIKDTKFFDVELLPSSPKINEELIIYVASKTDFSSETELELIGEFSVNGNTVNAEKLSPKLWSITLSAPHSRGAYSITARLSIKDKVKSSSLTKRIQEIEVEILNLEGTLVNTADATVRESLIAQINDKKALKVDLEIERSQLSQFIGEDTFGFSIESTISASALLESIKRAETRHVQVQNNDFGWDYYVLNPNELRTRTEASYSNQFGLHSQSLLDSYQITKNAYFLRAVENTANVVFNLPVGTKVGVNAGRCTYLYATDAHFLINAGDALGFPEFTDKGKLELVTFKKCMAAIYILNTFIRSHADIDTLPEADLAAITNLQIAQKYRDYLANASRNPGLRAFDLVLRFEEALAAGDRDFAKAIAEVAVADAALVVPTADYYLSGAGATLEMLGEFATEVSTYPSLIDSIKTQLLTFQKEDGLFEYYNGTEVRGGGTQDMAFILRGLLKIGGQEAVIVKALAGLKGIQRNYGGYFIYDYEFVEGQAELLTAMTKIAKSYDIAAQKGRTQEEMFREYGEGELMSKYSDRQYPNMSNLPKRFMFTEVEN